MTYLRFTHKEFQAISDCSRSLNLNRYPLHSLKRLLLGALAETSPELGVRIGRLSRAKLRLLCYHLMGTRQAVREPHLAVEELRMLKDAAGPLLLHARFVLHLKHALVQQFREGSPQLATTLERLSLRQFEMLCEQVRAWMRRS